MRPQWCWVAHRILWIHIDHEWRFVMICKFVKVFIKCIAILILLYDNEQWTVNTPLIKPSAGNLYWCRLSRCWAQVYLATQHRWLQSSISLTSLDEPSLAPSYIYFATLLCFTLQSLDRMALNYVRPMNDLNDLLIKALQTSRLYSSTNHHFAEQFSAFEIPVAARDNPLLGDRKTVLRLYSPEGGNPLWARVCWAALKEWIRICLLKITCV